MLPSGAVRFSRMEQVVFGRPAAEELAREAERRGASRVFLLASGTLARETGEIARVREALGARFAGQFDRMPAHTPREAVVEAANMAREAGADLLATFGGGSVTDGAKVVQICLRHGVRDVDGLESYRVQMDDRGRATIPEFDGPTVRQVSVPTTLSGGEFNPHAGCTDSRIKVKQGYRHPDLVPMTVILDPAPTVHTPEWLWLSTGIRAVDHAVEALCSPKAHPYCDAACLHALRLLHDGLRGVKADPSDLQARLKCQTGTWLSMTAVSAGVPMGASHAIGHILGGTCDVPHGYTSCVMLPAVMRWNRDANPERQALVAEALGRPGGDAGDLLDAFITALGLPRTLAEVGVAEDRFELIAKNAMHDRWLHTNPRTIGGPEDVVEILRMAS